MLNVWETAVITDETDPLGASLEAGKCVSPEDNTIKSFTDSNLNNSKSTFIPTVVSLHWSHAVEWDRQSAFVLVSLQQQSWPPHCRRSQNGDWRRGRRDSAWSRLYFKNCCTLTSFNHILSLNTKGPFTSVLRVTSAEKIITYLYCRSIGAVCWQTEDVRWYNW